MRLLVAAVVLAVFAGSALGQELVLPGVLVDEGCCQRLKGGSATTDMFTILRPTEIERHESACEFIDVKQSKMGPQVVRSLCSGEGSYWTQDFLVVDTGDAGVHVISFPDDGFEIVVSPCG